MNEFDLANERFSSFSDEVKSFKLLLEQLKKSRNLDELSNQLPPLDYAQLNASLAYSLNTILNMYKSLNGIPSDQNDFENEERIKRYFTKVQEVILTEAEHKDNPFTVNKIHAEKIIKEELYEKIHQDDSENQHNLWKTLIEDNEKENEFEVEVEKENICIEKIKSPVKILSNQENEPENFSEKPGAAGKKSKKKTQRIALASNENVPSWRKEFDKMYQ